MLVDITRRQTPDLFLFYAGIICAVLLVAAIGFYVGFLQKQIKLQKVIEEQEKTITAQYYELLGHQVRFELQRKQLQEVGVATIAPLTQNRSSHIQEGVRSEHHRDDDAG